MSTRWMSTLALPLVLFAVGCGNESSTTDAGVAKLKSLHRGELSALLTYDQAIAKVDTVALKTELTRIRDEHRQAGERLKARIIARGGLADTSAGIWGDWTKAVAASAAAIGDDPAIRALKTGEKHGIDEYEEAMKSSAVDGESKTLVEGLLARQREHVAALDRLLKVQ